MKPKNTRMGFFLAPHTTSSCSQKTSPQSPLSLSSFTNQHLRSSPDPSSSVRLAQWQSKVKFFSPFIYLNLPAASICFHKGADEALMEHLKDRGRWSSSGTMCVPAYMSMWRQDTPAVHLLLMGNDDTHTHTHDGVTMLSSNRQQSSLKCVSWVLVSVLKRLLLKIKAACVSVLLFFYLSKDLFLDLESEDIFEKWGHFVLVHIFSKAVWDLKLAFRVEVKLKFEFLSLFVRGNINYDDTEATVHNFGTYLWKQLGVFPMAALNWCSRGCWLEL